MANSMDRSSHIACEDRERIFADGSPQEWAALELHAANCASCAEEVRSWKELSLLAVELRTEWDSPSLWPRIEKVLEPGTRPHAGGWSRVFALWTFPRVQWRTAAATLLLVVFTASALWFVGSRGAKSIPENQALLNDRAVNEVERAEAAYERAIEKLDARARPQLSNASTPLLASYREKLLVLDSAISDLRAQAGLNPANSHLRRELLAMYQEKQDTLEQVLEAKQ